jgi:succinyl-diaminopimelate desuccinylase
VRSLGSLATQAGITELERHDAPDPRAKNGKRPNLVATIAGVSDAKRLWLMSHTDVVPPGDLAMWKSDPWTVVQQDGRLIGRGVEDNQQGLVSWVAAALALVENGITPPHTVKLLFVADEEMGSEFGIQWLLANRDLFRGDDMVVIPDGGDEKGSTIEVAEKTSSGSASSPRACNATAPGRTWAPTPTWRRPNSRCVYTTSSPSPSRAAIPSSSPDCSTFEPPRARRTYRT